MSKHRRLTKAEIGKIISQSSTPEALQQQAEKYPEWARRTVENYKAAEPVLSDLRKAGYEVSWITDIRNRGTECKSAIPILLYWLTRVTNEAVKQSIASALGTKCARPIAAKPLINELKKPTDDEYKWAVCEALEIVADDSVFDEIVTMALDKQFGRGRTMMILALSRMHNPRAVDILINLLSDPEVVANAIMALGKLKAKKARSSIEPFLRHDNKFVCQEAKRALMKIDKAR